MLSRLLGSQSGIFRGHGLSFSSLNYSNLESSEEPSYEFPSSKLREINPQVKNIALLSCGCFNPPTYAHLRNFESAKTILEIDRNFNMLGGFISPASDGYKKSGLVPAIHRSKMMELSIETSDFISLDTWEIEQHRFVRTQEVLIHLEEELRNFYGSEHEENITVSLLCGSDLLYSMIYSEVWLEEQVEYIMSRHGVAVIDREGFDVDDIVSKNDVFQEYEHNIFRIPAMMRNDISSTKIREYVRKGYSTKYYTPDSVREYIDTHEIFL